MILNGNWTLYYFPQGEIRIDNVSDLRDKNVPWIPCTVPGNVELDLSAAGILPSDLFKGMNITLAEKYEQYEWWYKTAFVPTPPKRDERVLLYFGAVDCIADYYVNGVLSGHSENMFISNSIDVTDALRYGEENTLHVNIKSALAVACDYTVEPNALLLGSHPATPSLNLRKAPHSFGWDIMPRALSAGIWRDVELKYESIYRFRYMYFYVDRMDEEIAVVRLSYDCFAGRKYSYRSVKMVLNASCGDFSMTREYRAICPAGTLSFEIPRDKLWMPKNYGKANMFDIELTVYGDDGEIIISEKTRQGFRTAELKRTDTICEGGCFEFHINGEKVFALGSNWVPLDAYHSRDKEKYADALALADEAGCNILRCWGGNVYEDEEFFRLCDEYGIMVWQDFAMACHFYPQTPEFMAKIENEATSVVEKYRNHASIVLWSGDNEVDQVMDDRGFPPSLNHLTREVIPRVLERLDPKRSYIPSSPFISDEVAKKSENDRPENHLWGPRDFYKSNYYALSNAYFVSETGYHGCPAKSSIERFIDSDKVWPYFDNEQWILHSTDQNGYDGRVMLMHKQVKQLFGEVPEDMEDYILASQISQAEAKKFFIERVRLKADSMGGVIWWNLLDGWPQMSDAVVDYYGTKKLAFEYIKRSSYPVIVTLCEQSGWGQEVAVSNIGGSDAQVELKITDFESGELMLERSCFSPANSVKRIDKLPLMYSDKGMLLIDYTVDGKKQSNTYLYGAPPFDLEFYKKALQKSMKL